MASKPKTCVVKFISFLAIVIFLASTNGTALSSNGGGYALDLDGTREKAVQANQACTEWNLASDFRLSPNQENPNRDSCGNPDVWHFLRSDFNRQTYTLLGFFNSSVWGIQGLQNWEKNNDQLPVIGINATGQNQQNGTAIWPAGVVNAHPAYGEDIVVGWRSPINGWISVNGSVGDLDKAISCNGHGINWFIDKNAANLATGSIDEEGGEQSFSDGTGGDLLTHIFIEIGDFLYFAIDPKGDACTDATNLDIQIQKIPSNVYLYPSEQLLIGSPGSTVQFVETLWNSTGITDTINLSLSDSAWPATLSDSAIGPLLDGEEVTVTVNVTIPFAAAAHSTNSVVLTATSGINPTIYTDTALLTTEASHSYVYLPIMAKPAPRITGKVTMNGIAAPGVALDLRLFNGTSNSTIASTTTLADGSYNFIKMPPLSRGQGYYIRYLNSTDDSRLYAWYSGTNWTYYGNDNAIFDTFDIANIAMLKPDPGATVSLPYTFTWTKRPATPTDSYEFDLFDFTDGDPWFYTDPPLGYVGSYNLTQRPTGFLDGVYYRWEMVANSPDGGYGISFYLYYVKFASLLDGSPSYEMKSGARALRTAWLAPGIPADR